MHNDSTHTREWADPFVRNFEDFVVGDECVTRGRTIDIGDVSLFAGLTGDHYPLHTDREAAASTRFGERIGHGPLTYAIAVGLVGTTGWFGDAIIILLEATGLRALQPVRAGDTVHVVARVTDATKNDSGRTGAVTIAYRTINQRDEEVFCFEQKFLMKTRAAAELAG